MFLTTRSAALYLGFLRIEWVRASFVWNRRRVGKHRYVMALLVRLPGTMAHRVLDADRRMDQGVFRSVHRGGRDQSVHPEIHCRVRGLVGRSALLEVDRSVLLGLDRKVLLALDRNVPRGVGRSVNHGFVHSVLR